MTDCRHADEKHLCTHDNHVRSGSVANLFGKFPGCIVYAGGQCPDFEPLPEPSEELRIWATLARELKP